jgi:hypothetical protein
MEAQQAAPVAQEVDPLDSFLASMDQQVEPLTADQVDLEAAPSLGQQIKEVGVRAKASFARSDKELKQVLEEKYGADNVKKGDDDTFLVKRPGQSKFTKFDADSFEIVGDLADWTRDVVEEGFAAPMTALAGATAIGGTATGVGALPAYAGAAALRAGGSAFGMSAGDLIAEKLLGIEQDPGRNKAAEYAIGGTLGAVLGGAGDYLGRWALNKKAAKAALDKLPSSSKQAQIAVDALEESVNLLKEKQLINPVTGTNIYATAEQFNPFSKDLAKDALALSDQKVIQAFRQNQSDMVHTAVVKHASEVADLNGKGTGQIFADYVDNIEEATGAIIGDFRNKFAKLGDDVDVPVPKFKGAVDELKTKMGFKLVDGKMSPPTPENLLNTGIVSDADEAKNLIGRIEKFEELVYNTEGKLSPNRMQAVRKEMTDITKRIFKDKNASYEHKGALLKMKRAIDGDELDAIEATISPDAKNIFQAAKSKYSSVQQNADKLVKLLEQDKVTSKSLMSNIFSGRAGSVDSLNAVKGILATKPELWNQIKGDYISNIMEASTDAGTSVFSPKLYFSKLDNLPNEVRKEIFPDEATYKALRTLGNRIDDTGLDGKPTSSMLGQLKRAAYISTAASGGMALTTSMDFMAGLATTMAKDEKTAKWLSQEGIEQMVKAARKPEQARLRNALYAGIEAVGSKKPSLATGARRAGARLLVQPGLRQGMAPTPTEEQ